MKKMTIDDVARRAGVSKATVSAVLNHKNVVRPETRRSVLKAIKELHYRPHPSARTLKKPSEDRGSIAVLIRELDNPFYTSIVLGVNQYAAEKGYLVMVLSSEGNHTLEEHITQSFSHRDIKGAVIAPVLEGTAEIEHLFRLKMVNFPFVLLEAVKGIRANVVTIDNIKAMHEAVKYLIDGGHSRIIHFVGPPQSSHAFERIEGFKRAYTESRLAFSSEMVVPAGAHLDDGYKACLEYFKDGASLPRPTAIVCYNDLVALGVMSALHEMHIPVPDAVSVVGNDDILFSHHVPVKLTTVRAPMIELGRKAAEILIRNIESPRPLPLEHVVLEAELVIRESTKPLQPVRLD